MDWPSLFFGFAALVCAYLFLPGGQRQIRKGNRGAWGAFLIVLALTGTAALIPIALPRIITSCASEKACKSWVKVLILRISDS
ncbi:MAG: hypothetical protein EPN45_08755 [Rhizobiaceae bacterium]|nr:MAG: hypothetical protein EPN45_08755 [Rhizobiaceae bacterium]